MKTPCYKSWSPLTPGATIDLIAPASRCELDAIEKVKRLLQDWQLVPRIAPDLLGEDLLCANADVHRLRQLEKALLDPSSQAVWCLRGGYGCSRLLPHLLELPVPKTNKLFVGFSDITSLHIFLQQQWGWQTLHGPCAVQVVREDFDPRSIEEFKKLIFGKLQQLIFHLRPLNDVALYSEETMISPVVGGNLSLVQCSLATPLQIDTRDKILFLEEVNETAYRVDRMLQHLQQSGILKQVRAILFGDFIPVQQEKDVLLLQSVLLRFAQTNNIPILQCADIGHGRANRSLPLASISRLSLKEKQLIVELNNDLS